ncbi:unnamed protein product [Brassica oleracea]
MGEHTRSPFAIASASGNAGGGSTSASSDSSFSSSVADTDDDQTIARMLAEDESLRSEGKLGRRLSHLGSIPHTPRVNRQIPDVNDATLDHELLSGRLATYGLAELQMEGDGNCQFRALADQLFRNADYHKHVRKHVVKQLKRQRKLYEEYVPMKYRHYRRKMKKPGEWGDHVTLQAAADRVLLPPIGHTMQSSQAGWKNETKTLIYGPRSHIRLLTHNLYTEHPPILTTHQYSCNTTTANQSLYQNLLLPPCPLHKGLATALQLADPFSKTNQSNDVVFLRIATHPMGRKMLTKYVELLLAVFRHLRFLFGGLHLDANLANQLRLTGKHLEEEHLVVVVCSSEQPSLRPIGSCAGDGASVVLISLLERVAEVVVIHDGLWRASFDEFFKLLTTYCGSKYETVRSHNQGNAGDVLEVAIKREMPAELLQASLRHAMSQWRMQGVVRSTLNL